MNAACQLVADRGYDGFSLRELTAMARVNLAAVSYYFDGKKGLFLEIVRRRIRPLNEERLTRLDQITGAGGGQPPSLEQVLDAFVRPVLAAHRNRAGVGPAIAQILARSLTDPLPPYLSPELAGEPQLTLMRFAQAIRRHVPGLPPDEFLWRFTFVVGAMQHALSNLHQMSALTRGICRDDDHDCFLARFVEFSAGVFTAPG
jgi:AcrR family transcriptional regulator